MDLESSGPHVEPPNSRELVEIALFLEGIKLGKGNLLPLGVVHLENLWKVIRMVQKQEKEISQK